jgi:hypothetical protein
MSMRRSMQIVYAGLLCITGAAVFGQAQTSRVPPGTPTQNYDFSGYSNYDHEVRPQSPLAFRETWKPTAGAFEHPVLPANVANPNLELHLYGPSGNQIQMNGDPGFTSNPPHLWTGLCQQICAATLRDKNNYVDLSGFGKIRWFVKVSGLHLLHPIIKLADGTWLLGEHGDANQYDLLVSEFTLSESRWIKLDIDRVVTVGRWLDKVDLTKVDEIGFTDLMPGSGHGFGGYSDVGWVEVWGKPIPRKSG